MNPDHLFHSSEEPDIVIFHPRPPPSTEVGPGYDCVWAIGHETLSNYLAPRDCSRVIVRCDENSSAADTARFIGNSQASTIMTIERQCTVARHRIDNPAAALAAHGTELRLVDNLWPLIDAVVGSTMRFSIIRKRNATPPVRGPL